MDDVLKAQIDRAFSSVCDAEALIYAAGITELKPDIIHAHTILLRLRNEYGAMSRKREAKTKEVK